MTKVFVGMLCFFLVAEVHTQPVFKASKERLCSNENLTFTCIESQSAQSVLFYKDNDSTTARCLASLGGQCSPTFPPGFDCACVKSVGSEKTILYNITNLTSNLDGPWFCAIPTRGAANILSNIITIKVDDRGNVGTCTGLVITLAILCVVDVVVVIIVLKFAESKILKIVVTVLMQLVVFAFLLAVGIICFDKTIGCVRATAGLYEASIAFLVIGSLTIVVCIVVFIVLINDT